MAPRVGLPGSVEVKQTLAGEARDQVRGVESSEQVAAILQVRSSSGVRGKVRRRFRV